MKKKLNTGNITNELEGASLFFTKRSTPPPSPEPEEPVAVKRENPLFDFPFIENATKSESVETPVEKQPSKPKKQQSTNQSTDQSTNRLVNRSIDQSTSPFTDFDELGPVVEKPKAFYITQKVDRWLDEAVRYLQDKGLHKIDRSILVNALLHKPELFKNEALDELRNQLLTHLTNKSLKRA